MLRTGSATRSLHDQTASPLLEASTVRPPLIDCLFPVPRPRLLLPAASLPCFSQVRHMRMRKSIKRYVTVLELTDPHHDVQLSRTIFATVDLYYPTRPFDAIFASNDCKNCEDFAKWNNNNNRPPACIRPRLWDRKQPIKYSWPKIVVTNSLHDRGGLHTARTA